MSSINLTPNELLTTTRSVRKRLDLKRAVEREVIEECLAVAQQAPTASNMQNWHFLMITDSTKRARLSELYRKGWEIYSKLPTSASSAKYEDAARMATQARVASSAKFLADHLHEVPVHVIPCIDGRTDNQPTVFQSAQWGTIAPASWSFILAARTRGLGAVWTCMHLYFEEEAARLLGIPYSKVMQTALVPVAYTKGTKFRPASRQPLKTMVHWEAW